MATTYAICYCISPVRRCKSRGVDKLHEHFDEAHWAEIKSNLEAYMRDDVCVPYANQSVEVDAELEATLHTFVSTIAAMRETDPTSIESFSPVFTGLQRTNAYLLNYGLRVVDTKSSKVTTGSGPRFDDVPANNQYVEMAKVLSGATRRAAHELRESVRVDNPLYVLHHQALLYDLAAEMTRLSVESTAVVTEKLLEPEHPHRQLLEEKWERDGI
ncbi:hypothetical protein KYK30_31350 [Shinella yambaruensis]|uniref:Uncharacterized protein n=1 Tax=Shinella yambaruensis TaxID=415996 RepID=A0ABQ5ZQM9_9HYPH|nr:hypothetical protein [Shinella yambaruensis]MCJ8029982.1 hypothetical protein [Shinella yambaruensis]MCU7984220.1 hypothetical protein [Shinella yambaruensis]GLR55183.1 hypothetical protein GCM10007923_64050 [Shinella yambaruensis]